MFDPPAGTPDLDWSDDVPSVHHLGAVVLPATPHLALCERHTGDGSACLGQTRRQADGAMCADG